MLNSLKMYLQLACCMIVIVGFPRNIHGLEMNYCAENTFNTSGNFMQLTKEASFEEFALVGKFKALHCCAKGYRSIEWYKDGKLYPWPLGPSHLILYPESANQTIYAQAVTEDDSGNYTCVLRNDSTIITHTIHLTVFEKVPTDPKITYISQDVEVILGNPLRLFCEAFGGLIDLPDAKNIAEWRKIAPNDSNILVPDHVKQKNINREDFQTFGTYLLFPEVRREDYGTYSCKISKPGNTISRRVTVTEKVPVVKYIDPNPFPLKKMIFSLSAIVILFIAVIIIYRQFGLKLQLRLKDSLGPLEVDDGKTHDVLIVYSPKDSEIALGVLLPVLENSYNYKCASRELSTNMSQWYTELKTQAAKCRRTIAIISPSAVNDTWDSTHIHNALSQLKSIAGPNLINIFLKELPQTQSECKNAQGETLKSTLRTVYSIFWQRDEAKYNEFKLKLLLRLPARRANSAVQNIEIMNMTTPRLTMRDSQESLNNLV